jgi:hypothetical protein
VFANGTFCLQVGPTNDEVNIQRIEPAFEKQLHFTTTPAIMRTRTLQIGGGGVMTTANALWRQ